MPSFRRIIQKGASRLRLADRFRKVERGVDLQGIDKPQAQVDKLLAEAVGQLAPLLETSDNVAIQVGSLLVIKTTNGDGRTVVVARTLTQDELRALRGQASLLNNPEKLLSELSSLRPRG